MSWCGNIISGSQSKNTDDLGVETVGLDQSPLCSVAPVFWHQQWGLAKESSETSVVRSKTQVWALGEITGRPAMARGRPRHQWRGLAVLSRHVNRDLGQKPNLIILIEKEKKKVVKKAVLNHLTLTPKQPWVMQIFLGKEAVAVINGNT